MEQASLEGPGLQGCIRWCQSNGNSSPAGRNFPPPSLALTHDGPPLGQRGRASFAVQVSADEVAFLAEVIVPRAI